MDQKNKNSQHGGGQSDAPAQKPQNEGAQKQHGGGQTGAASKQHGEGAQKPQAQNMAQTHVPGDLHSKCEEYKNDLLRLAAEFDNYKKRAAKDAQILRQIGREDAILQFLAIKDELASALAHAQKSGDEHAKKGLELLVKKIDSAFASLGVEEIKCEGEPDHNFHEAMLAVEGNPEGKIAQVLRKGYTIAGRLLRPAQVSVYSGEKNGKTDSGEHSPSRGDGKNKSAGDEKSAGGAKSASDENSNAASDGGKKKAHGAPDSPHSAGVEREGGDGN